MSVSGLSLTSSPVVKEITECHRQNEQRCFKISFFNRGCSEIYRRIWQLLYLFELSWYQILSHTKNTELKEVSLFWRNFISACQAYWLFNTLLLWFQNSCIKVSIATYWKKSGSYSKTLLRKDCITNKIKAEYGGCKIDCSFYLHYFSFFQFNICDLQQNSEYR